MPTDAYSLLTENLKSPALSMLRLIPDDIKKSVTEIRLNADRPVMLICRLEQYFIDKSGRLLKTPSGQCVTTGKRELGEIFSMLCDYSVFSHQNQICRGFVTLKNGHRAGICGTAVIDEKTGRIKSVRDITSINLRVARQIYGCADKIIDLLRCRLGGIIIAGPPNCGKTTMLRDTARQLCSGALGRYVRVAIADERCEIAPHAANGFAYDLGCSCDVLSNYPKADAIEQAVRSLSPEAIICDEVCTTAEVRAIEQGMNSGVSFIVSLHADSLTQLKNRSVSRELMKTGAFERVVLLDWAQNSGRIKHIYGKKEIEED